MVELPRAGLAEPSPELGESCWQQRREQFEPVGKVLRVAVPEPNVVRRPVWRGHFTALGQVPVQENGSVHGHRGPRTTPELDGEFRSVPAERVGMP